MARHGAEVQTETRALRPGSHGHALRRLRLEKSYQRRPGVFAADLDTARHCDGERGPRVARRIVRGWLASSARDDGGHAAHLEPSSRAAIVPARFSPGLAAHGYAQGLSIARLADGAGRSA